MSVTLSLCFHYYSSSCELGFCAFYCFDGLFRERPFEILAYVAAVTIIVLYIIINYILQGLEDQPLRLVSVQISIFPHSITIVNAVITWYTMHSKLSTSTTSWHMNNYVLYYLCFSSQFPVKGSSGICSSFWSCKCGPCTRQLVEDGILYSQCYRNQHEACQ